MRITPAIATFGLALVGAALAPSHACKLASPTLLILIILACFVLLPLLAFRAKSPAKSWTIAVLAPVLSLAACWLYVEVLHWQSFPAWLLSKPSRAIKRSPNPEPAAVGAGRSAVAVHAAGGRWLSCSVAWRSE